MDERTTSFSPNGSAQEARRRAMAVLAAADTASIAWHLKQLGELPSAQNIRAPECGLVMVRGRIGGDGAAFNLGEATVTRAAVRLQTGEVGFGYALGRDTEKARLIAHCDALLQESAFRDAIETRVIAPLREAQKMQTQVVAEQSAATRVDFFTLVRGED
ncbi:MAG TPA: phosphonate C-P lyase system protein PhnG [Pseudorhodoplanes sp.]|nr:phosphonate C-P lyase system protein PhnG [Pseudorhodoplanes sp.]